ncbi:MAG: TetR/AcrR family transcriptional regulator [Acholeplasmatales bacterium]|nr:TetR/AcrR family transcriptional regulator [Acholeplasmatales bacterium]
MANNLQVESYIRLAFIKLIAENPYETISVTDIVNTAGVSRTSFYRFYKQKDDLLKSIKKTINSTLQKKIYDIINADDIKAKVKDSLSFSVDEKKILDLLLKAHEINYAVFAEYDLPDVTNSSFENIALYGAVISIILSYILKGMKDNVDTLSETVEKIVGYFK